MTYNYKFKVDLRYSFPEVRDQGIRGTCTAFAVTASHEHHRNLNERLSEEFLFSCAKLLQGSYDENGVSVPHALESIKLWGHTTNNLLPYRKNNKLPLKIQDISPSVFNDALNRKIALYNLTNQVVSEIENLLNQERAVITGVMVYPTFSLPDDSYFIDVPIIESIEGYHAILIVGFGERNDGRKCFIIRNSWGSEWGDKGYAYISYEYFIKYNIGAWTIPRGA